MASTGQSLTQLITRFRRLQRHEYELQVDKMEEIKLQLAELQKMQ